MVSNELNRRAFAKVATAGVLGGLGATATTGSASAVASWQSVYTTSNLNIRDEPSTSGGVIRTAQENTGMHIIDGPWDNDGYTWWRVQVNGDANNYSRITGYAAEDWMERANFAYGSDNTITDVYCRESWSGCSRNHDGIDIAHTNDQPRPIYAAGNGSVRHTGWISGYGNTVIVDHGNGFETLYAHLSEYDTYEGASVDYTTRIGTTGETGNSTGVHLHFEIQHGGTAQNWPMVRNAQLWNHSGVPRTWF